MQVERLIMSDSSVTAVDDNQFVLRELDGRIRRFIASMPEQRRKVFIMSRYKGMGNKSIADTLGISVRTVDRHINMALTSLKKEFLMK